MQLLYSPTSPFARKVRVVAYELDLDARLELAMVNPWTDEALRAQNPLSKVPTLVTDTGETLFDSRVICEYLSALGEGDLFPSHGEARWRALTLQALADGMGDAAVRLVRHRQTAPDAPNGDAARQEAAMRAALDTLEDAGFTQEAFHIGEIAVAAQLGYLDFRQVLDWRADRPHLAAWFEAVGARPSMIATAPADPAE